MWIHSQVLLWSVLHIGSGIVLNHTQSVKKHCRVVFSFLQVASFLYIKKKKTTLWRCNLHAILSMQFNDF